MYFRHSIKICLLRPTNLNINYNFLKNLIEKEALFFNLKCVNPLALEKKYSVPNLEENINWYHYNTLYQLAAIKRVID